MPLPLRSSMLFATSLDNFLGAIDEFEKDGPRGCAVLGHAILEQISINSLRAYMVDLTADEDGKLFKGTAPLSTMSARIRLLHALGLIDTATRDQLEDIKFIRNALAHTDTVVTFDSQHVSARCLRLKINPKFEHEMPDKSPRTHFVWAVKIMAITLLNIVNDRQPPLVKPSRGKPAE